MFMKKNSLILVVIMLFCSVLMGCNKEEAYEQITIEEIEKALSDNIKDISLNFNEAYLYSYTDWNEGIKHKYSLFMERQNIDTSDLMVVDRIRLSGSTSTEIYFFKFSNIDSAVNCYQNYKTEEDYRLQRHGNLVVMAHKDYSINISKVINKIR